MGRFGRTTVALCALAIATTAGCGSEAEGGIEAVSNAPKQSAQTACALEHRVATAALEAYVALHGEPPTATADLLDVLAETPTYVEVEPDGTLGLTAEAERLGCTLPVDAG